MASVESHHSLQGEVEVSETAKVRIIRTIKLSDGQWATTIFDDASTSASTGWDWSRAKAEAEHLGLVLVVDEREKLEWRHPDWVGDLPEPG
jgi:hypothetical protein